jgi:hypothetical protein
MSLLTSSTWKVLSTSALFERSSWLLRLRINGNADLLI